MLEYIRPWTDLYKVDLKSFDDRHYRELGGRVQPILDSLRRIHAMGFWLEVVTLIIPGFNDLSHELRRMADFLAAISPDIPWPVTALHADYKMLEPDNIPPETLLRAAHIGHEAGLRYVYAGNLPGRLGEHENTCGPSCHRTVVERRRFRVLQNLLGADGKCPGCGAVIPGQWVSSSRKHD